MQAQALFSVCTALGTPNSSSQSGIVFIDKHVLDKDKPIL